METNELQAEIAVQIIEWHSKAQDSAGKAKAEIEEAVGAAINCGRLLSIARDSTRGRFIRFCHDSFPGITHRQINNYLEAFKKSEDGREQLIADHRFFQNMDLIEVQPSAGVPMSQSGISPKWVSQLGSVRGWFDKLDRDRPIPTWPEEERQAVADQLKPIVAIYQQLTGV